MQYLAAAESSSAFRFGFVTLENLKDAMAKENAASMAPAANASKAPAEHTTNCQYAFNLLFVHQF